jgi:hypothetical protein
VDLEELSYCGFSPSALITKYSGDHLANKKMDYGYVTGNCVRDFGGEM